MEDDTHIHTRTEYDYGCVILLVSRDSCHSSTSGSLLTGYGMVVHTLRLKTDWIHV